MQQGFFRLCSFLDPRFKTKYLADDTQEEIITVMRQEAVQIISHPPRDFPLLQHRILHLHLKKVRSLGSLMKIGAENERSTEPDSSPESTMQSEISLYLKDS